MKKNLIFLFAFLTLIFTGCSDDDNTTDNSDFDYSCYQPIGIGFYHISDTYQIDNNGVRLGLIRSDDSIVFTHEQMIGNKNCTVLTKFDTQGNIYMALPEYFDGSKLYVFPFIWDSYVKFFKENLKINFPFTPSADELWVMADFGTKIGERWNGFPKKSVTDFVLSENATMTATLEYYGERTKEYNVTIQDITYDAIEIVTHFIFEGHTIIDGNKTEFYTDYKQKFVYGCNVGSVLYYDFPFVFDFGYGPIPGGGEEWASKKVYNSRIQ